MLDFFWPQVLHTHLVESRIHSLPAVLHLVLLQETVLAVCLRFPRLALKTAWWCIALVEDFREKRINASQFAATVALLLQLDLAMTGSGSMLSEVPSAKVFADQFFFSGLHQEELLLELSTLFRARLRISHLERTLISKRIETSGTQDNTAPLQRVRTGY